jgi:hypothetical protein
MTDPRVRAPAIPPPRREYRGMGTRLIGALRGTSGASFSPTLRARGLNADLCYKESPPRKEAARDLTDRPASLCSVHDPRSVGSR